MRKHSKSLFVLTITVIALSLVANVLIFQAPTAEAQGSGTVRMMTWDSGDALAPFNRSLEGFAELYPDITVELEPVPQEYGTKLLAQLAAGTGPDIFQVGDGDVAKFLANGVMAPLDEFINGENGLDMGVFYPAVAAFGQTDEGTYLLTKDFSPLVLYYNKDHFDEAGLAYPSEGWTWEDFLTAAQTLTTEDRWGVQLPGHWGDWLWDRGIQPVLEQNGATLLSPDGLSVEGYMNSEETVEALQWYVDLFLTHKVAPTREDVDAYAGVDLFTSGIVSMVWTGRWPLADYKAVEGFNFGTAGLPAGPAGPGNTLCWAGFAMNAESENKEAAWTWLKYIAAEGGAEAFADYAFTAVQAIADSQGLTEDEYDGPITADLANAKPIPEARSGFFGECVGTPFKANLETVFLSGVSVQDAMDAAVVEAQACLDENNG